MSFFICASICSTRSYPSLSVIVSDFHSVSVSDTFTKRRDDIAVADVVVDMVAEMEMDMVADMEVDTGQCG